MRKTLIFVTAFFVMIGVMASVLIIGHSLPKRSELPKRPAEQTVRYLSLEGIPRESRQACVDVLGFFLNSASRKPVVMTADIDPDALFVKIDLDDYGIRADIWDAQIKADMPLLDALPLLRFPEGQGWEQWLKEIKEIKEIQAGTNKGP